VSPEVRDDWYVGFHEGLRARFWRLVSEPLADEDAAAILALLDLPAGARVLDAPCGAGRIAVRLAEGGLDVTGIDLSAPEIAEARRVAGDRGVRVRYEVRDVRDAPAGGFDAVVCWGNSFGYLTHEGTVDHLHANRRALRDGGRLLLDTSTVAEAALPLRDELDYDLGEVRMQGRNSYDVARSRILTELRFTAPGSEPEIATVAHHVYTVAEIVRLLQAAGFEVDELLGDPRRQTPFELGAGRLVVVATPLAGPAGAVSRLSARISRI
jgi:SAM-dependent methyltransferase